VVVRRWSKGATVVRRWSKGATVVRRWSKGATQRASQQSVQHSGCLCKQSLTLCPVSLHTLCLAPLVLHLLSRTSCLASTHSVLSRSILVLPPHTLSCLALRTLSCTSLFVLHLATFELGEARCTTNRVWCKTAGVQRLYGSSRATLRLVHVGLRLVHLGLRLVHVGLRLVHVHDRYMYMSRLCKVSKLVIRRYPLLMKCRSIQHDGQVQVYIYMTVK